MSSSLAETLTEDEIPIKFRCVICKRLALDAFRLPCCDSPACATCHAELPDTCPVCSHNPLSKDDCRPNKSLRQTVKAFLRSEEKKRQKDKGDPPPQAKPGSDFPQAAHEIGAVAADEPPPAAADDGTRQGTLPTTDIAEASLSDPPDVVAKAEAPHESNIDNAAQDRVDESVEMDDGESDDSSVVIRLSPPPPGQQIDPMNEEKDLGDSAQRADNQPFGAQGNDFGTMNGFGNFGGWPMNGAMSGMNGMNPMMAMQNGMGGFDFQNMMGMMGGMNPAMMQQMQQMMSFGGFNGGMGMNGMNGMNMGQMGFDNGFGGWGMPNAMSNMTMSQNMNGDFGNNGYYQGPRNNRGNFGRGRFRNNNFQRNDFRGHSNGPRGFAGRRSSFLGHSNGYAEEPSYTVDVQDRPHSKSDETQEAEKDKDADSGQAKQPARDIGREILNKYSMRHYLEQEKKKSVAEDAPTNDSNAEAATDAANNVASLDEVSEADQPPEADGVTKNAAPSADESLMKQDSIPAYDEALSVSDLGPNVPQGPAAQYAPPHELRGRGRGGTRGFRGSSSDARGGRSRGAAFGNATLISPVEPQGTGVVGAPTGPKALREGGPNIGFRGRANTLVNTRGGRGSGFASRNGLTAPAAGSPTQDYHKPFEPRRSRSRSPAVPRSSRRYSSDEREDYESDYERKRDRKHKYSRRHDDDYHKTDGDRSEERYVESIDLRSRRDRDRHRSSRHERERSDDRTKRRHHQRYNVDNTGLNGRDVDAHERPYESSRRHRRDTHRDRRDEREERPARPRSPAQDDVEEVSTRRRPQEPATAAPKREFKIQGRSKQSELEAKKEKEKPPRSEFEIQKEKIRKEKPDVDVYTLEREAAQRERLLKEEQRRGSYGIGGGSDRKRSRDELETYDASQLNDEPEIRANRKKSKYTSSSRRSSHKYDGHDMSAIVDRAERERESARY